MQTTKTHCKYAHYAYVHVTHNHITKESYISAKEPCLFAKELFCSGKIRLFFFFVVKPSQEFSHISSRSDMEGSPVENSASFAEEK